MRSSIVALIALLSAGPLAAEEVSKWNGAFVGVHAGYAWSNSEASISATDPASQGTLNSANYYGFDFSELATDGDGFLGGVQAGYNFQRGIFVWGVEADISRTGIDEDVRRDRTQGINTGQNVYPATVTDTASSQLDWFGTVRLRGGIVAGPKTFLYATGGLAYGRLEQSWGTSFDAPTVHYSSAIAGGSDSSWQAGWTIGGGGEFKLTDAVSLRAEYLYYDLADTSYLAPLSPYAAALAGGTPGNLRVESENTGSIVRAALNFKLDRPAEPLK